MVTGVTHSLSQGYDGKSDDVIAVAALQCFAAATSLRESCGFQRSAAESREAGFGAFDAFEKKRGEDHG